MDLTLLDLSDSVVQNSNNTKQQRVPNRQPSLHSLPYKIAIIGEAPGKDEVLQGQPFVGISGKLLTAFIQKRGLVREGLFLGNVCQIQPPNNDISKFNFQGEEIQSSLVELAKDLDIFQPNICLLLGRTALYAAKGVMEISNWRGSFFIGEHNCFIGRKCIASYHPAACLRNYDWTPLLMFDIGKCRQEAESKELTLPKRDLIINLSRDQILNRLEQILQDKLKIAIDIEGGINSWSCISIATSPVEVFIIPLTQANGLSYWSTEDECFILGCLSQVLADPAISKILQNSLYDRFVLQYSYSIIINGVVDDTMLKSWEKYCELDKGLGFLCSLYTKEPYYKSDRKSNNQDTFWQYCCKDSALTYEISNTLDSILSPQAKAHYDFNVELLTPLLYMELKGILYDTKKAKSRQEQIDNHIYSLQDKLNRLADIPNMFALDRESLRRLVINTCCHKRDEATVKKEFEGDYEKVMSILSRPDEPTEVERGYISIACNWEMNVKSVKYKDLLYNKLLLPAQYNVDKLTKKRTLTTDNEALLTLKRKATTDVQRQAVDLGIQIMELRTRSQMLSIYADKDKRIRCGYNLVGTVTGRITSYTSPTGSGYNLQTIPDDYKSLPETHPLRQGMRDLFLADNGYTMCQCDLKGSDGWTIGAHLFNLGDSTMLEDLRNGIKPAARVAFMLGYGMQPLLGKTREEIKELLKVIKKDDWKYFACKVGIWGQCYTLGPDLQSAQISKESYGMVNLSRKEITDLRDAVFATYNIRLWHRYVERLLAKPGFPKLASPSGNTRIFFGRKQNMLGDYLSSEPQNNTTYATNLAALNLWKDKENRQGEQLRIQPLHQVHDALIVQFKTSEKQWAVEKLKSYFNNKLVIAGIPIVIPFEGNMGRSWGELDETLL